MLLRKNRSFNCWRREIGLEVNVDKTKYLVISRDQNARRSHNIKTDNSSSEILE